MALAMRPCLPMTLPMSSSATLRWNTMWSPVFSSVTSTSSGLSTIARAMNSMSSFIGLLRGWGVLGGFGSPAGSPRRRLRPPALRRRLRPPALRRRLRPPAPRRRLRPPAPRRRLRPPALAAGWRSAAAASAGGARPPAPRRRLRPPALGGGFGLGASPARRWPAAARRGGGGAGSSRGLFLGRLLGLHGRRAVPDDGGAAGLLHDAGPRQELGGGVGRLGAALQPVHRFAPPSPPSSPGSSAGCSGR